MRELERKSKVWSVNNSFVAKCVIIAATNKGSGCYLIVKGSLTGEGTTTIVPMPLLPSTTPMTLAQSHAWKFTKTKTKQFKFQNNCRNKVSLVIQKTLNVREGITVRLVSHFTGLDSVVSVHTEANIFSCLVKSNPVNLKTSQTVILALQWVLSG